MRSHRGGAVTVLVLILTSSIMLLLGLVVDASAKAGATAEAQTAAAAAARAAVNAAGASELSGSGPNLAVAITAAREYLRVSGVQGSVELLPGGNIRVTTQQSRRTAFVSIIGIRQVTGTGQAEASLIQTGGPR